jgi:hypothetical protein
VNDRDILRQVSHEGKVKIGGHEFSIKPEPKKTPIDRILVKLEPEILIAGSEWKNGYARTFAADRVRNPDFFIKPNPTVKIDSFYNSEKLNPVERPEVQLREGVRAALRAGLSQEKIKEIFDLELVQHIMEI